MGWAHAGGTVLLRNVPTCETADAPGTFTAITRALTLVIAVPDCAEARNGSRRSVAILRLLAALAGAAANVRDGKRRGGSVQQASAGCPLMTARACWFRCGEYGVGVESTQVRAGFRPISRIALCQVPIHTIGKSLRSPKFQTVWTPGKKSLPTSSVTNARSGAGKNGRACQSTVTSTNHAPPSSPTSLNSTRGGATGVSGWRDRNQRRPRAEGRGSSGPRRQRRQS